MQHSMLSIGQAAEMLRAGDVIAYPTEAVYGLGCDPANDRALRAILSIKKRSADAGLILIAHSFDCLSPYIGVVSQEQLARAQATWPGHVTWLFPRSPSVSGLLAGSHKTIAVRITAHAVCRSLCAAFGGAIVSTSANPSGKPPAMNPQEVTAYFPDSLAGVVRGRLGGRSKPSEIRDLATGNLMRAS